MLFENGWHFRGVGSKKNFRFIIFGFVSRNLEYVRVSTKICIGWSRESVDFESQTEKSAIMWTKNRKLFHTFSKIFTRGEGVKIRGKCQFLGSDSTWGGEEGWLLMEIADCLARNPKNPRFGMFSRSWQGDKESKHWVSTIVLMLLYPMHFGTPHPCNCVHTCNCINIKVILTSNCGPREVPGFFLQLFEISS